MSWEFNNVIPVIRNSEIRKYDTSLSAGKIAEMFQEGIIIYEGSVQRGTKMDSKGREKDIVSTKKIKEIYKSMITGELHGGVITLNYLKEYDNPLEYDSESKTLTGEHPLLILDGQHRIKACHRWWKEFNKGKNKDILPDPYNYEFPITIENLSEEDMKKCFAEYALMQKKISKTRAEFLNVGDLVNQVVRYINQESELRGRVECTTTTIRGKNPNVVTFSTLSQAIKYNFSPRTKDEANDLAKYLTEFIDALVNTFPDELGENKPELKEELRQKSLVSEALSWFGYMRIAKDLYGSNGKKKLKDYLKLLNNNIVIDGQKYSFLDKNNPIWKNIFRENNKIINNTSTQKIIAETMSKFIKNNGKIDKTELEQIGA